MNDSPDKNYLPRYVEFNLIVPGNYDCLVLFDSDEYDGDESTKVHPENFHRWVRDPELLRQMQRQMKKLAWRLFNLDKPFDAKDQIPLGLLLREAFNNTCLGINDEIPNIRIKLNEDLARYGRCGNKLKQLMEEKGADLLFLESPSYENNWTFELSVRNVSFKEVTRVICKVLIEEAYRLEVYQPGLAPQYLIEHVQH